MRKMQFMRELKLRLEVSAMNAHVLHRTKFAATLAAVLLAGSAAAQSPRLMAAATAPAAFADAAQAQPLVSFASDSSTAPDSSAAPDASSASDLPDAPSATPLPAFAAGAPPSGAVAGKYVKYIPPNETAQPITAQDKVIIGLRDAVSIENVLAWVTVAGYEQAVNGAPNYGTNSTAFGKRFGASVARETSQGIFTDCVFSPLLRMDPRYYAEGSQYNFFHRVAYAATRVIISKTDSGKTTINSPLLLGYAASTALSNAYYPQINRNFHDSALEYGGSLGGAAIGFLVNEFVDDALRAVHLKK
jgi:hypothetical protein